MAKNAAGQPFTYTGAVRVLITKAGSPRHPAATMPDHVTGTNGITIDVQRCEFGGPFRPLRFCDISRRWYAYRPGGTAAGA